MSKYRRLNKFGAKRSRIGNEFFPSKLEAAVYSDLLLREKAKEITNIKRQVSVKLTAAKILYIVDFSYQTVKTEETVYVEAKGYKTAVFALKRRLWKHYGPAPLEIWVGTYKKPVLGEFIVPKAPPKLESIPILEADRPEIRHDRG